MNMQISVHHNPRVWRSVNSIVAGSSTKPKPFNTLAHTARQSSQEVGIQPSQTSITRWILLMSCVTAGRLYVHKRSAPGLAVIPLAIEKCPLP